MAALVGTLASTLQTDVLKLGRLSKIALARGIAWDILTLANRTVSVRNDFRPPAECV